MKTIGHDSGNTFAKIYSSSDPKISGPGASAVKYDILTALLVTVAQENTAIGRLASRLALVITARFNWRNGHFIVGQRELARMWGVTERTTKREMALMRNLGWIRVDRPAARGRVAQYRIDFPMVLKSTAPYWASVGPDFAARMSGSPDQVETESNIVPLVREKDSIPAEDGSDWPDVATLLQEQDAGLYGSWFANLTLLESENGCWVFLAPTRFAARYIDTHLKPRLLIAIATIDRTVNKVVVLSDED